MNNILRCVLLLLAHHKTFGAAEKPYHLSSHKPYTITVLEEEHEPAWNNVYRAIDHDDTHSFEKHVCNLVNKAKFVPICSDYNTYIDARTLVELLIDFNETSNRAHMLSILLQKGAHTRSNYTVSCTNPIYSIKHHTPIYYAIIKGNTKAFKELWLADHTVPCDSPLHSWFPEEEAKPTPADTDLNEFIMVDGSFEDLSQEPIHPILELWASPEKKIHDPFLAEHGFVFVEGVADKIRHEKSIRGFLVLLKDMIENPKKYPQGTPLRYHENKRYDLPPLHAIRNMLNITQTEPQKGLYSSLAKSFSDLSSLFFWK